MYPVSPWIASSIIQAQYSPFQFCFSAPSLPLTPDKPQAARHLFTAGNHPHGRLPPHFFLLLLYAQNISTYSAPIYHSTAISLPSCSSQAKTSAVVAFVPITYSFCIGTVSPYFHSKHLFITLISHISASL